MWTKMVTVTRFIKDILGIVGSGFILNYLHL